MGAENRIRQFMWLGLMVASATAGWFYGCGFVDRHASRNSVKTIKAISTSHEPVFAVGSPEGLWVDAVKKSASADFPKRIEEWGSLFPERECVSGENPYEGRPENAFRWLLAVWLVKDSEGFLKATTRDFQFTNWQAEVFVQLRPEKAAELIRDSSRDKLDQSFVSVTVEELAKHHPTLYLKINSHGDFDATPGMGSNEPNWYVAIASLAKKDPVAAWNDCLEWDTKINYDSCISRAFLAVAEAWRPGDPPISELVNGIANPKLHNIANHARLSALAEKDPKAALAELYSAKLEVENSIIHDAPNDILMQLARSDLVAALKLLKDVERIFSNYGRDPFTEPSPEEKSERITNPFSELSPGRYSGGYEVENNGVRHAVLAGATENLPTDPTLLFEALHQLRTSTGNGDSAWQRGIEGDLIRRKCDHWSAEVCLTVAKQWEREMHGEHDDPTYQQLAIHAALVDPEQTLAALNQVPESARALFACEIIKQLPASNPAQRIALFSHLNATQWDEKLGEILGRNAVDYASAIASMPGANTLGARQTFMEQWGKQDPEAAAHWLASLPVDAASFPTAKGLAIAWVSYDESAATVWGGTLRAGPARDGAAVGLAHNFADGKPDDAWLWARLISDAKTRELVFYEIADRWKNKAPEQFREDYRAARMAVGLPFLQGGTNLFEEQKESNSFDPFKPIK